MKRMIAFFVVIMFLFSLKFINENNIIKYKFDKLLIVSQCDSLYDVEMIENGNQYYYTFSYQQGKEVLKEIKLGNIDGLVYYFDKSIGLEKFKNNLDFCFESQEKIDGLKIFYGYDNSYPDFRYIDNKKINVQIVENSTNIIVGFPIILCGY